jgi:hypothetical protein
LCAAPGLCPGADDDCVRQSFTSRPWTCTSFELCFRLLCARAWGVGCRYLRWDDAGRRRALFLGPHWAPGLSRLSGLLIIKKNCARVDFVCDYDQRYLIRRMLQARCACNPNRAFLWPVACTTMCSGSTQATFRATAKLKDAIVALLGRSKQCLFRSLPCRLQTVQLREPAHVGPVQHGLRGMHAVPSHLQRTYLMTSTRSRGTVVHCFTCDGVVRYCMCCSAKQLHSGAPCMPTVVACHCPDTWHLYARSGIFLLAARIQIWLSVA